MLEIVPYNLAREKIQTGDVLLFRCGGLIPILGRGRHSHAGLAAWWHNDLMCLEVREWVGGRAVLLSSQVERFPGQIDVYAPLRTVGWEPPFNAAGFMRRLTGCHYGWFGILLAALTRLPVIRWIVRPCMDDKCTPRLPPFCSWAVSWSYRRAGVDLVPNLADHFTEPADLARSAVLTYQFTLGAVEETEANA